MSTSLDANALKSMNTDQLVQQVLHFQVVWFLLIEYKVFEEFYNLYEFCKIDNYLLSFDRVINSFEMFRGNIK